MHEEDRGAQQVRLEILAVTDNFGMQHQCSINWLIHCDTTVHSMTMENSRGKVEMSSENGTTWNYMNYMKK